MSSLASSSVSARRGFTLTELAIVLGVVGLVIGGIWSAANAVYESQRVDQTTKYVMQILNGTRKLFAGYPKGTINYSDTNTLAMMVKAGVIPQEAMGTAGDPTTMTNLWGGTLTIKSNTCASAGNINNCMIIQFGSLPKNACTDLALRVAGPGRDSGFDAMGNGSYTIYPATGTVTSAITLSMCPNASNTLFFSFLI